ncbi:MAG: HlyD family efflux transporter periplasmic adaptor subunit [Rhizobiaceae bacterium]|nr:HlyD family efflux transporter periplasmic adaptor subunit [Rhizobiaceae bacterium]
MSQSQAQQSSRSRQPDRSSKSESAPGAGVDAAAIAAANAANAAVVKNRDMASAQSAQSGQGNPASNRSNVSGPGPSRARESDITNALLNLEREARKAETEAELGYLMVNGSRVAVQYRQALLVMRSGGSKHRVVAVSSLSAIDRNSTFIRWVERLAKQKLTGEKEAKVFSFDVRVEAASDDLDASSYPFSNVAFVPLQLRDGTVFAHLMLTREGEWDERSLVAATRLCETFSHSWEALTGPTQVKRKMRSRTLLWIIGAAAIVAAGFYPVPLSVLAPAEVTPTDAFIVASPADGAIESIEVDPNSTVSKGQLLFTFADTDLRNRVKLAGQAVSVAEARYQQSLRTSFSDSRAKRELSIAQSELKLKASEYDFAQELLKNSRVTAGASGLVLFADKETWTGRPVSVGERIMRIADPSKVEVTINLPVSDAIILKEQARVELYLDSNPLKPVKAAVSSASFHARPDGDGVLSYRVRAEFAVQAGKTPPRIGLRGTAKVYGDKVRLGYYLMRKPISAIRQWTGY